MAANAQPATLNELRLVAEARKVSPLTVPEGTATKLVAAGVTVAQARARLFQMIVGERSDGTPLESDDMLAANMRHRLARAAEQDSEALQRRRAGSSDPRARVAIAILSGGFDPKDAA